MMVESMFHQHKHYPPTRTMKLGNYGASLSGALMLTFRGPFPVQLGDEKSVAVNRHGSGAYLHGHDWSKCRSCTFRHPSRAWLKRPTTNHEPWMFQCQ